MNFLTICKEVNDRMGFQGELVSTEDASGYQKLVVDMTSDAWRDVQSYRSDWDFLRTTIDLTLTVDAVNYDTYSGTNDIFTSTQYDRFGHWDIGKFNYQPNISTGDQGRQYLTYVSPEYFRTLDTSTSNTKPNLFTVSQSERDRLRFFPVSTAATVQLYYYKSSHVLDEDSDTPESPQEHHQLIVWAGLKNVANFMGNAAVYQYAIMQYDKALGALMRREVPSKTVAMRPLV